MVYIQNFYKRYFKTVYLLIFLGIAYVVFSVIVVSFAADVLTNEYQKYLSSQAVNIALIAASDLRLTDSEFEELKNMSFAELHQSEVNQRLTRLFESDKFSSDLRFAYIMHRLKPNEIKYFVDESNTEYYGAPVGTPLDSVWLMDAVVNKNESAGYFEDDYYSEDIRRYTYSRPADIEAYNKRDISYLITDDEFGNCITGYVPVYTVEGTHVGILGVDIYFNLLSKYRNNSLSFFAIVYLIPGFILIALFSLVYVRYVKRFRDSAFTDSLTGVSNRAFYAQIFPKIIRNSIRSQKPLTVVMLDIDNFKNYNEHYGHIKGDQVIRNIAKVLSDSAKRPYDVIVRYGGEEFLMILPDTDHDGAATVCERIKNNVIKLNIEHKFSACANVITVSMGITSTVCRIDSHNKNAVEMCIERFVRNADTALYRAKSKGRNRYIILEDV